MHAKPAAAPYALRAGVRAVVALISPATASVMPSFGKSMRKTMNMAVGFAILLACGCTGHRLVSGIPLESRTVAPAGPDPVKVVCELRYYVVGDSVGRAPPLQVLENDGKSLTCAVPEPFQLLEQADTNRAFDVRGFVLQVIKPAEHVGRILTVHFDGPLASGNPFSAFAIGRHYQMDVSPVRIGKKDFELCY
jgi:hypothetical protein